MKRRKKFQTMEWEQQKHFDTEYDNYQMHRWHYLRKRKIDKVCEVIADMLSNDV